MRSTLLAVEMLGSIPWWVLYPGGGLLFLVATVFLLFSLYLAYIHRKYSHLPSPKMPRYGSLHAVRHIYYQCISRVTCDISRLFMLVLSHLTACCSFYLGHIPDVIAMRKQYGNEFLQMGVLYGKWYELV